MRKFLVAFLISIGVSSMAMAAADRNFSVTDLQSMVGVVEMNPIGSHGSGTFIDPVHMITASHVAEELGNKPSTIRMMNGDKFTTTGEAKESQAFDLAILTIDAKHPYAGKLPKISCDELAPLTRLTNVGNPIMAEFVVENVYTTGGRIAPVFQAKIDGPKPGASPPDAIMPPSGPKSKAKKRLEADPGHIRDDERQKVFANTMIVQGSILQGQSGSTLFDDDGNIVGILNTTFTNESTGSYTGLGAAVKTTGPVCQWIKDQVGDGVFK
jgi:S1-C subfamily serine protease